MVRPNNTRYLLSTK